MFMFLVNQELSHPDDQVILKQHSVTEADEPSPRSQQASRDCGTSSVESTSRYTATRCIRSERYEATSNCRGSCHLTEIRTLANYPVHTTRLISRDCVFLS